MKDCLNAVRYRRERILSFSCETKKVFETGAGDETFGVTNEHEDRPIILPADFPKETAVHSF